MGRRTAVAILTVVLLSGFLAGYSAWELSKSDAEAEAEAASEPQGRVCVSAEVWSADDAERPCARIVRVWEDGSTQVRVTQADGGYLFTATTGARW